MFFFNDHVSHCSWFYFRECHWQLGPTDS